MDQGTAFVSLHLRTERPGDVEVNGSPETHGLEKGKGEGKKKNRNQNQNNHMLPRATSPASPDLKRIPNQVGSRVRHITRSLLRL